MHNPGMRSIFIKVPIVAVSFSALCCLAIPCAGQDNLSLLGRQEIDCPVCEQAFTTLICTQTNTRGGVDRDLLARALGPQPVFFEISTCPRCAYSGYIGDFKPDVELSQAFKDKLLKAPKLALPDDFTPDSDPRMLDAADRYRLAITCYTWRERSDEALAWLHLRASWVARDTGAMLPPDDRLARVLVFSERWRPEMEPGDNQADIELRLATRLAEMSAIGRFNRYQRPYVELTLLLILRRHGENLQAEPMVERLMKTDSFSDVIQRSLRDMKASIDLERDHQRQALTHFKQALAGKQVEEANIPSACYLVGELSRRLGEDAVAIEWFDRVIADEHTDPQLRRWAQQQRSTCTPKS